MYVSIKICKPGVMKIVYIVHNIKVFQKASDVPLIWTDPTVSNTELRLWIDQTTTEHNKACLVVANQEDERMVGDEVLD